MQSKRSAALRVIVSLRQGVTVIEALEVFAIRLLGFAALMYELVRGFLHGK